MTESLRFDTGFGDARAPVDSEPYAQRWRIDLQAAVEHLDIYPSKVHLLYEVGTNHRLWTFLRDASGRQFRSFGDFCRSPKPHGLGTEESTIRAALEVHLGKRGADLETVSEPIPGPGRGHTRELNGEKNKREANSFHPVTKSKLRAISRAPDAVKDAYREGRVSQSLAAKLGPKNPTPEQAARVAEAAHEVRKAKDRREADAAVRRVLGVPTATLVDRAFALVQKMSSPERLDFERQVLPLFEAARRA